MFGLGKKERRKFTSVWKNLCARILAERSCKELYL
jgi:hypothetical protein